MTAFCYFKCELCGRNVEWRHGERRVWGAISPADTPGVWHASEVRVCPECDTESARSCGYSNVFTPNGERRPIDGMR